MMSSDLFYISGQKISRIIGYILSVLSVVLFMFAFAQSADAATWTVNISPAGSGSVRVTNYVSPDDPGAHSAILSGSGGSFEITATGLSSSGSTVFKEGDTLTFSTVPATGYTLDSWSPAPPTNTSGKTIADLQNRTMGVNFVTSSMSAKYWQINIDPDNAGSVTVSNNGSGCTGSGVVCKTISGAGGSIEIDGSSSNSFSSSDTLYFRATAASGQTFVNWSSTALGPNDNQANSLQPQSANGPLRTVTASFRQAGSTFRDQITVRLDPPFAGTVLIYGSSLPDPDPNTPNPTQTQNEYTFFYDASNSFRVVAQDGFTNDFVSWEFPWGTSTNLGVSFDNTSGLLDGRYGDFEIVAHYNSVDFCSDGIQNAGETGVDCGVVCFNTCPDNTGGTGGDGGAGTGGPGGTGGTGTFTPGKLANPLCGDPNSPDCVNNIPDFLKRLIEVVMVIGIPIVTLGIIYSGFLFVQAQGRPQKLTEAKNALLYSAIGGGILLGAWVIATAIGDTLSNFT